MSSRKQKNKREYKAKRAAHLAEKRRRNVLFQAEGTVQMTREGYCFVNPDSEQVKEQLRTISGGEHEDIFVKANKTRGALNGDKVTVDVTKQKNRIEGVITQITERSRRPFVGFLHIVGDQAWVLMQSKVMPYDISISDVPKGAKPGYKVAAVVDDWPRGEHNPIGHIVDVLGEPGENDTEMHAILAEYGLPYRFEPYIQKAADKISEEITASDIAERKDFRKTFTFTIDPTDARDFDDAISCRKMRNGNFEIGVHIADVTHYVLPDTVLDKEAQARGTSVYLVDRTVPMLPEKLSNKLCSLRPGEEKLCFSAVFEMTPDAKVKSSWIGRTIIKSDARLDYDMAQQIIVGDAPSFIAGTTISDDNPSHTFGAGPSPCGQGGSTVAGGGSPCNEGNGTTTSPKLIEAVRSCWALASQLRDERFASGAVNFERPEMKVICDDAGRPVDVRQKVSVEANWLIEEFMLLANRTVAEFVALKCNDNTFVYRVHDEPNQDKVSSLRTFVKTLGYKLAPVLGGDKLSSALNSLLLKAKDQPEAQAISLMCLRCMSKAKYDVVNIGHYGLAFKYYTHFTSPIRRYPDMMVHRLLSQYLTNGKNADKAYYQAQCKHASEREQIAADAERASIKYKLVEYMMDKTGSDFHGTVSGITEWGMYVEILPTHIEGMVALRDIKSDYYVFDEEHYQLRARHSKKKYTMGTPVHIRVTRADLDSKQIDFELIED